jgi:penicillin amidase
MPDWAREQVNAYTAGVNAFISSHHGAALPPEFSLLRFEPEPFTGADVTVWVKMMAWDSARTTRLNCCVTISLARSVSNE